MEVSRPSSRQESASLGNLWPPPSTIAIQPSPKDTSAIPIPGLGITSLVRHWAEGDPARCRLCPKGACIATAKNFCHHVVNRVLRADEAPLYSTVGFEGH